MVRIDMKDCLYHGINFNLKYNFSDKREDLVIFESILSTRELLCGQDAVNHLPVHPYGFSNHKFNSSDAICLGFYPTIKKFYKAKGCSPENIENYLNLLDTLIYRKKDLNFYNADMQLRYFSDFYDHFAWKLFYPNIVLLFDPKLLSELNVMSYSYLHDEIRVSSPVSLDEYLIGVAISKKHYTYYDKTWTEQYEKGYVVEVWKLLKKYNYNVPIVDFDTGLDISDVPDITVRKLMNEKKK